MGNTDLILHDNENIKELFMSDAVEEILITTDPDALILDESSQVGYIDWACIMDFGLKGIVVDNDTGCDELSARVWHIKYDKVVAAIVRYHDADDVETFISKNRKLILKR